MNFSGTLDVVIGLTYTFLILSLVVSAGNELIASFLRMRAKVLEEGIGNLLQDPAVKQAFFDNHLIKSLGRDQKKPSYIASGTFVAGLLSALEGLQGAAPSSATRSEAPLASADLLALISKITNPGVQDTLLTLFKEADGDVNAFRTRLAKWYDEAMDRVSGWYKRRIQMITLCLGLVVSFVLNVDSMELLSRLGKDPTLSAALVNAASNQVSLQRPDGSQSIATVRQLQDLSSSFAKFPFGWNSEIESSASAAVLKAEDRARKYGEDVVTAANKARRQAHKFLAEGKTVAQSIPYHLLGWIFTATAVSLGAPFWFDLLTKFVNLRGSGPAPKKGSGSTL